MNGRPYLLLDGLRIGVRGNCGMGPLIATFPAVERYDELGGLAADATARLTTANELANALSIPFDQAAELLADALARRATNKLRS